MVQLTIFDENSSSFKSTVSESSVAITTQTDHVMVHSGLLLSDWRGYSDTQIIIESVMEYSSYFVEGLNTITTTQKIHKDTKHSKDSQ